MEKRFTKCPKCESPDVEIHEMFGALTEKGDEAAWGCWDCDWIEALNGEEKDARETGE